MGANRHRKSPSAAEPVARSPRRNVLLALTLVPVVAGVMLIIAWAIDWELVGTLENQAFLGLLFILGGFALSNLAQGKWLLFAGWGLLTLADLLLLTQVVRWIQFAALILAGNGLLLLAFEFYRTYRKVQSGAERR